MPTKKPTRDGVMLKQKNTMPDDVVKKAEEF